MNDEREELRSRAMALVSMGFLERRVADSLSEWTIEEIEQLVREIESYLSS